MATSTWHAPEREYSNWELGAYIQKQKLYKREHKLLHVNLAPYGLSGEIRELQLLVAPVR